MAGVSDSVEPALKPKLRVAFCHPDLGIGGAERLVVDAASELARRGHSVHVFTAFHDPNRCFPETLSGTFQVTVYGNFIPRHIFRRFHALCAYLRCVWVALCMLLFHGECFDVVFVDQVSAVIPILKLKSGCKVLFYCHFPDLLLAQHGPKWSLRALYRAPIDFVEEATIGMADCVVVNSKFTAATFASTFKRLAAQGLTPSVLYPAVLLPDLGARKEGSDSSSAPEVLSSEGATWRPQRPFFLSLNRYERKKEVEIAVKAQGILAAQRRGQGAVDLVVAGGYDTRLSENVEYLQELKAVAAAEGIADSLHFLTSISDAQKAFLLRNALAVLYTPQKEHFGLVPLEAMAYGLPVVACNSGGPIESIEDGATGFLCEPTPVSFAVAMVTLLVDPEKRQQMGRAARRHVEAKFSTAAFGDKLEQLLCSL